MCATSSNRRIASLRIIEAAAVAAKLAEDDDDDDDVDVAVDDAVNTAASCLYCMYKLRANQTVKSSMCP